MYRFAPLALALAALPALAAATPIAGMAWSWPLPESRRYYVENEVVLPLYMWFIAEKNKEARVAAWQVRMVIDCDDVQPRGKHAWDVMCRIEDIGLKAAALPGDQATSKRDLLGPILAEMDEALTGSRIQLVLKDNGRVQNVDLEDVDRGHRRASQRTENLRMVLQRAVAGFDMQLPKAGASDEGMWIQHDSLLMAAPNQTGSFGTSDLLTKVESIEGDRVILRTAGKGMVAPVARGADSAQNLFDTKLSAGAVFDRKRGMLTERIWTVDGVPTASSALSEGGQGTSYFQSGRIVYLPPGIEAPAVGPTEEVSPPGDTASALQRWNTLWETGPSSDW